MFQESEIPYVLEVRNPKMHESGFLVRGGFCAQMHRNLSVYFELMHPGEALAMKR